MSLTDRDGRIFDAHVQLWDDNRHSWKPRYLVDDLLADISLVSGLGRVLYVECGSHYREEGPEASRSLGETEWVAGLAASGAPIAAIVGMVDVTLGRQLEDVLEAHIAAAGGLLRGLRITPTVDPQTRYYARPRLGQAQLSTSNVRAALSLFAPRNLSLDFWAPSDQLEDVAAIARDFPDLTLIIDHLGAPMANESHVGRPQEVFSRWYQVMETLATYPNVALKIGGFGMAVSGLDWHLRQGTVTAQEVADYWKPHVSRCIDMFGIERCMLESNYGRDAESLAYQTIWEAYQLMIDGMSQEEWTQLHRDNALRVYRLT
jgi:predicted TIM-barrel fold metal-dependent hydrolase